MQPVKSCCCQHLDCSLQDIFMCDMQNLLWGLQWNESSTVVSLSYLSLWYFLHRHASPVKRNSSLSFPAVKLLCFGAFLAAWGMCQSPPWSLSHLKISRPLWGLCSRGISLYFKSYVLLSVGSICFSYMLYVIMSLSKANGLSVAMRKWPLTVWLLSSACLIMFVRICWQQ